MTKASILYLWQRKKYTMAYWTIQMPIVNVCSLIDYIPILTLATRWLVVSLMLKVWLGCYGSNINVYKVMEKIRMPRDSLQNWRTRLQKSSPLIVSVYFLFYVQLIITDTYKFEVDWQNRVTAIPDKQLQHFVDEVCRKVFCPLQFYFILYIS